MYARRPTPGSHTALFVFSGTEISWAKADGGWEQNSLFHDISDLRWGWELSTRRPSSNQFGLAVTDGNVPLLLRERNFIFFGDLSARANIMTLSWPIDSVCHCKPILLSRKSLSGLTFLRENSQAGWAIGAQLSGQLPFLEFKPARLELARKKIRPCNVHAAFIRALKSPGNQSSAASPITAFLLISVTRYQR